MSDSPSLSRYGVLTADATPVVPDAAVAPAEIITAAPAAPALAVARIVGVLAQTFVLAYAVEYLGKIYRTVTLSRPSSKQVGDFFERLAAELDKDENARVRFPIYFDDEGKQLPDAVLDVLDDDDMQTLAGAADRFLPKRLRIETDEASSSSPGTGADTGQTSAA